MLYWTGGMLALTLGCIQVRGRIRSSGVNGLDCTAGCGVFVGYGFGIGLFLKPQAADAMQKSMQKAQGMLSLHMQYVGVVWLIFSCQHEDHEFCAAANSKCFGA